MIKNIIIIIPIIAIIIHMREILNQNQKVEVKKTNMKKDLSKSASKSRAIMPHLQKKKKKVTMIKM